MTIRSSGEGDRWEPGHRCPQAPKIPLPHTRYWRLQQHTQLCLLIWVNAKSVPLDTLFPQTARLANKCRPTHVRAKKCKHQSPSWMPVHPSRSDCCLLHLASAGDAPGYGSGSRSSTQMGWAFNTTCSAFSNCTAAKTIPYPHLVLHPMGEASCFFTLSDWPIGDLFERFMSRLPSADEGQLA